MNIYINDLSKYYKNKKALDHITLHLSSGIYGLIGPNGAGKTRMSVWIEVFYVDLLKMIVEQLKLMKLSF